MKPIRARVSAGSRVGSAPSTSASPARRAQGAREQPDRRRLAGAAGADDADDRPARDREVDARRARRRRRRCGRRRAGRRWAGRCRAWAGWTPAQSPGRAAAGVMPPDRSRVAAPCRPGGLAGPRRDVEPSICNAGATRRPVPASTSWSRGPIFDARDAGDRPPDLPPSTWARSNADRAPSRPGQVEVDDEREVVGRGPQQGRLEAAVAAGHQRRREVRPSIR